MTETSRATTSAIGADISAAAELATSDPVGALGRLSDIERTLDAVSSRDRPGIELQLRVARMGALFYRADTESVFREADQAFGCLRELQEDATPEMVDARFRLHLTVGVVALYAGLYDHSVDELGRAAEIAGPRSRRDLALALGNAVYALVLAGRAPEALAAAEAAAVLVGSTDPALCDGAPNVGGPLLLAAATARARVLSRPSSADRELAAIAAWEPVLEASPLHGRAAAFHCIRAETLASAGRAGPAESEFRRSIQRADSGGHALWAAKARVGLAQIVASAAPEEARALLEEVVRLAPVSNVVHCDALEMLSDIVSLTGDTAAALHWARAALSARNRIALYQTDRRISRVEAARRMAAAERDAAAARRAAASERTEREIAQAVSVRLEQEVESRTRQLRDALERLEHQASHDALTGLSNRRHAQVHLRTLLDADRPCGLLYCDVDRFKLVNDLNGHEAGDWLLVEMARRLRRELASGDFLARLGGDEFVIVCDGVRTMDELLERGRSVVAAAERPLPRGAPTRVVGISVGAALSRPGSSSVTSLMREADTALYRAKALGGACVAPYDDQLRRDVARRVEIEQLLHSALLKDGLGLAMQPIVDLATGRTDLVEVYARVLHPRRGSLAASEFLDVAEETGLLGRIDAWLLDVACRWAAVVPGQRVSLNLRWADLSDPAFVERVDAVLGASRLAASRLVLEISERGLTEPPAVVAEHVARIKELGVQVALDDFGTAHSSLAALRSLPLDFVKLDRSFVAAAPSSPSDASIVQMVASLGRQLGISVIAEGLESAIQAEVAARCGCDYGQGFHLGRPTDIDLGHERISAGAGHPAASASR